MADVWQYLKCTFETSSYNHITGSNYAFESWREAHRSQRRLITACEQGAAPDRLQLRSFLTSLSAAGELGRCVAASAAMHEAGSTLAAATWSREVKVGGVGVSAGAASWLWRGVWVSGAKTNQHQHNKALHPTAYSSARSSLRFRRRVSWALACCARRYGEQ